MRVTLSLAPKYPGDTNDRKVSLAGRPVERPDGRQVEVRKVVHRAGTPWQDYFYRVDAETVRTRMTLADIRESLADDLRAGVLR